jgi:hypothetical protein
VPTVHALVLSPKQRALRHLIEVDWELYVRTQVLVTNGFTETALRMADRLIGGVSAEIFVASVQAARRDDVTELLREVQCPALILQPRNERFVSNDTARQMVAAIPNARLARVGQRDVGFGLLGNDEMMEVARAFFAEGDEAANPAELPKGTVIIIFADIADSTALTERLGDTAFRAKARQLGGALRAVIRECAGTPVEGPTLGDGVLAMFTSAREAIEAAQRCGKAGDDAGLPLHLGLHAGDVIRRTTMFTAGPLTSPRASVGCRLRGRSWCRRRCARSPVHQWACGSRTAGSIR